MNDSRVYGAHSTPYDSTAFTRKGYIVVVWGLKTQQHTLRGNDKADGLFV
jgi:hypothetical protein